MYYKIILSFDPYSGLFDNKKFDSLTPDDIVIKLKSIQDLQVTRFRHFFEGAILEIIAPKEEEDKIKQIISPIGSIIERKEKYDL